MAEQLETLEYNSENRDRQKTIDLLQDFFQQDLRAPPWLDSMETPFKWACSLQRTLMYFLMYIKLQDYKNQGAFYGFEKFAIILVQVFKRVLFRLEAGDSTEDETDDDKSAEKIITSETVKDDNKSKDEVEENSEKYNYELEEALAKCEETLEEMALNKGDVMYTRIGPVFHHVLQATKAHIMYFDGRVEESKELARTIQQVEEMPQECKAGVEGLKTKFIMSMYEDYKVLFPILYKAIELDPQFGYWYYLTGKVKRRLRREFNETIEEEELEFFEKAVKLERNPKFFVFLAQAYQEMAYHIINDKVTESRNTIDDLLEKSVNLYSECWSLKKDSASITRRVGNGMLKMKGGHVNKTVAKEALLKAQELSPENSTNLPLGKYYYYHERDDEKALEYFEKDTPSNFATPEIIRLKLIRDPDYDPHDDLLEWLTFKDQGKLKRQSAYCDGCWYYLIYKRDLEESVRCIWQVLKMDRDTMKSTKAEEYTSYGFLIHEPINLIEVLVNEILLTKEKNENLPSEDRKDISFLENFLTKVLEKRPNLCNLTPNPNLLYQLKTKVENKISAMRRRRYGNHFKNERNKTEREHMSWRGRVQEPNREQGGSNYRSYNQWHNYANRENYDTRDTSHSRNELGGNREYRRDNHRRQSESQSSWSNLRTSDGGEGTSNQGEYERRFDNSNRGRTSRQNNSYNNNRYDVTVTNWRSENRQK